MKQGITFYTNEEAKKEDGKKEIKIKNNNCPSCEIKNENNLELIGDLNENNRK